MVRDRIVGAFLGLACGDALGAPAEFMSQSELQARWGRLTEMTGGGIWQPGEWTDDTGMALCVAEGILAAPIDPIDAIGDRFHPWAATAKDVGSTIRAALSAHRGDWVEAARSTPQAQAGLAAGNGSLMRTLPVALTYGDEERMLRTSARVSAMTHWDPQAEVCCALYCLWVQLLLAGEPLDEAWQAALEAAHQVAQRGSLAPDTPGPAPLPAGFWDRLAAVEGLDYAQLQPSGYAGYVVECLEAAAWCCLNATSPEEAIVQAVNLAGEADTIAAVAGGAAGAAWGRDALPSRWLEKLHQRQRIEETAHQLARLREA
jgi:ADP-ribosyl-[dinitrogen reductase] hydrolase